MEEAVIGCIMIQPPALYEVADILTAEMFYDTFLSDIFDYMINSAKTGKPYDMMAILDFIVSSGKQDQRIRLSQITDKVVSTAMIALHAIVIKEKYLLRRYLALSADIRQYVEDGKELDEVIDMTGKAVMDITSNTERRDPRKLVVVMDSVISLIGKVQRRRYSYQVHLLDLLHWICQQVGGRLGNLL